MEYFWTTFINMVDGYKLITILALILVDFILGIIVALKEGKFELAKIAEFLNTSVLYFLGGYLLLGIVATVETSIGESVVTAAWALLDATMVGFILEKAKKLGLPIPDKIGFLKFPVQSTPADPPAPTRESPPVAMKAPPPVGTDKPGENKAPDSSYTKPPW